MLEITADSKAKKAYEGVNLGCVRDKYAQILSIFVSSLSQERSRQCFQHIRGIFHEKSDCSQNLTTSLQIQKSLLGGNKVELVGRIVATFYDICIKTWRRSRATESLKLGFHPELTRVKQVG